MELDRELVLRLADAEMETITSLNNIMQKNGLPFFLMEPIMDKVHRHMIDGKAAELAAAKEREKSAEQEETK